MPPAATRPGPAAHVLRDTGRPPARATRHQQPRPRPAPAPARRPRRPPPRVRPDAVAVAAQRPQPVALGPRVGVAGVLDPGQPFGGERGAQPARGHRQQRAQPPHQGGFRQRGHACQPGRAAAPQQPHRHRLRLVARMMAEQQIDDAGRGARRLQRRMARRPRAGGQRGPPFEPGQRQHPRGQADRREALRRQRRLGRRFGARPWSTTSPSAPARPAAPPRPGPAAPGTGCPRRRKPRPRRPVRRRTGPAAPSARRTRRRKPASAAAGRLRAATTPSRRSARGVGNSARSLSSVAQAARFSPIAFSALARPSSRSAACPPVRARL